MLTDRKKENSYLENKSDCVKCNIASQNQKIELKVFDLYNAKIE